MRHFPLLSLAAASLLAADLTLDTLSVTDSRIERPTSQVPQAVDVISAQAIENLKMTNISQALKGNPGVLAESKNGGYDVRLVIRGAGLKAPYGVREIMVLRDGVPMTDPDSLTRFDFVDLEDVKSIEIVKGPGSLYSAGSYGGTIHIRSKSVFEERQDRIKVSAGNYGSYAFNGRISGNFNEKEYWAFFVISSKQR